MDRRRRKHRRMGKRRRREIRDASGPGKEIIQEQSQMQEQLRHRQQPRRRKKWIREQRLSHLPPNLSEIHKVWRNQPDGRRRLFRVCHERFQAVWYRASKNIQGAGARRELKWEVWKMRCREILYLIKAYRHLHRSESVSTCK